MKVREKKRTVVFLLLVGVACAMLAGCGGKGDETDGLVSLANREEEAEKAGSDASSGEKPETADIKEPASDAGKPEAGSKSSGKQAADQADSMAEAGDSAGEGMADTDKALEENVVYVYVCGAVNCPGVYKLKPDARVYEAIEAAGGLSTDAAAEYVNQAQKVEDGVQIYVPDREEAEQGLVSGLGSAPGGSPASESRADTASVKVNINSATVEELKTLPGIGDAKAQSIVSYRQTNGMFQGIEDLMDVEGIKSGVFEKIKDKITV